MHPCHSVVVLMLAAALQGSGHNAASNQQILNLPLRSVPIVHKDVPLSRALSLVGIEVSSGYVLFGIEVHLMNGREPSVNLNVPPGSTLGDALGLVLRQLPEYRFEVVPPHVITVYPLGATADPDDLLNLGVPAFDVVDKQADAILSRPQEFVPALNLRLSPSLAGAHRPRGYICCGLSSEAPGVTLHLRNVTVRQLLNATSEASGSLPPPYSPLGWVCFVQREPKSPTGRKYSWAVIGTAPHDWRPLGTHDTKR